MKTKRNRRFRPPMTRDKSQVSVGGLLALGYGLRNKSKKKEKKI
jgi:hypothetical protein